MRNIIRYIVLLTGITGYAQLETINTSYEYDNLNRLVQVVSNNDEGFENNYEYDNLGNRISKALDNANNPNLTYVPDDAFEQKLIDEGYDDVIDDYVVTANIVNVITLNMNSLGISDMTGIEDFSDLQNLSVAGNNISEIDVTQNSFLESLDVQQNQISELNINQNSNLRSLECDSNFITSINLTNNPELDFLNVSDNQLSSLSIITNPQLVIFYCSENELTELDVSLNPLLFDFRCNENNIETMDLTQQIQIESFEASNNQLQTLNVRNGNNQILSNFEVEDNPNLFCIQVDDEDAANAGDGVYGNWDVDPQVSFSEDCTLAIEELFTNQSIIITPNPVSDLLTIHLPKNVPSGIFDIVVFDMTGKKVKDEEISNENHTILLSVKSLQNGIYNIKIKNSNKEYTSQFIKK